MPSILIEVRRQYTEAQEIALMEAVHAAVREAFAIKPHDRTVRLVAYAPHRFAAPPALARPECYTHVTIDAFPGRSLEAKRALYRAVVSNLEPLGIPRDHVMIVLHEPPKENWGIRGGQAGCDLDPGVKTDV